MTSTPFAPLDGASPSQTNTAIAAGRVLILAGAVFGAANLAQWAVLSGVLHASPALLSLTWPVAVGVFLIVLNRLRCAGGEAACRVAVWSRMAVLSQIAVALGLAAVSAMTGRWTLMMEMSVAGLALYGVGWTIAAVRTRTAWIAGVAMGCWAAAGGLALLVGTPTQYLAYACGLAVFALVPGLALVIRGRI